MCARRRRTCGLGLCDLLRGSRAGGAIDFGSPARGAGAPAESCALAAYQSTLGHQYLAKLAGDARAAERASAALRARERRVARDAGRWLREILPRWEERKGASRTRVLWRRGLPPSVRSAVWPLAIGNSLKMTHDLYEICVNKAQAARDDAEAARGGGGAAPGRGLGGEAFVTPAPALAPLSHSAPTFDNVPLRDGGYAEGTPITPAPLMGPSTPSVGSEPSVEAHSATSSAAMSNGMSASSGGSSAASDRGAPASRRWRPAAGLVAGAPGGSQGAFSGQWRFQPSTPPVVWTPRSFGREGSSCLIEADAARTFPELQLFRAGGALHPHLIHVLEAYVFYRPDVGYVQGMSYLAAMLLLYLEPAGAFCCLANLLNQHFFLAAFRMDDAQLRRHFNLYELMFADQLPRLYRHFDVLKLRPEAYLMSWIFTLFTKALDLEVCARVWDNYLLDGEAFVLRTALAILHCLAPRLEGAPLEACCGVLRDGPREISEDALFAAIDKFSAGSTVARNLERISSDYWQKEIPSEEPATAAYF